MRNRIFFLKVIAICFLLSVNHGLGQWEQCGQFNRSVKCFAIYNSDLYLGTRGEGVFVSSNLGNSWQSVNDGLNSLYIFTLLVKNDKIFCGTNKGPYVSNLDEISWSNDFITVPKWKTAPVNSLTIKDNFIYLSSELLGIYKKSLNSTAGKFFAEDHHPRTIISNDSIIIYSTSKYFYISTNNGDSWQTVSISGVYDNFAINNERIYAGSDEAEGIYYSDYYFSNWKRVNNGLQDLNVEAITFNDEIVVAGTESKGIFISTNKGDLWNESNIGLNSSNLFIYSLIIKDDYIFAGTSGNYSIFRAKISDLITSVDDKPLTNSSSLLYPNPAQEYLEISNLIELTNFQIFSIEGILQFEGKTSGRIDVSDLACGMYYIKIGTEVLRFVKI